MKLEVVHFPWGYWRRVQSEGAMSGRDTPRIEAPLAGCCHCGNVELALETNMRPEELSLRADTCSFCRKHGARTTSDPSGRVVITVHRPEQLLRYRFGLRTADFLVCGHCGIYVAAVIVEGSSSYATVNVNTLDAVDRFTRPLMPVTYEGESAPERSARRKARWTPALIVEEGRQPSEPDSCGSGGRPPRP